MGKRKWNQPYFKDLSVSGTNESNEHHAVSTLELSEKSTWICSCGRTFSSKEDLKSHTDEFWDGPTGPGSNHWEQQLS